MGRDRCVDPETDGTNMAGIETDIQVLGRFAYAIFISRTDISAC